MVCDGRFVATVGHDVGFCNGGSTQRWVAKEAQGLVMMGRDGRLVTTEGHKESGQWRSQWRLRWEPGNGGRIGGWSQWRVAMRPGDDGLQWQLGSGGSSDGCSSGSGSGGSTGGQVGAQ